jgi:4-alpha-glucanotransferase
MDDVVATAARWSIEPRFFDAHGRECEASAATLGRIVEALAAGGREPVQISNQDGSAGVVAYQGDGSRAWGLAVQLYMVRSRRNWGHGDFTDLLQLINLAARLGAGAVGLNPLHALFPDRPESCSPYSPNSRLFLNPLYIDTEALPEFESSDVDWDELKRLRASDLIDYAGVGRCKLNALRRIFSRFSRAASDERRADLAWFRHQQGEPLARFAAFESLRARLGDDWRTWPAECRRPSDALIADVEVQDAEAFGFAVFLQWVADRQLAACAAACRHRGLSVGLYIDLAVGADSCGAEAWSGQDFMLASLSVGAPPDLLNTKGQNWGLVTFNPHALAALSFEPFRALLGAVMQHAGAIRIDHVLGLKRLYLIPHGASAADGAYIRFPFVDLLRVSAEESNRCRCIVIGEDLGTVPEGFRDTMRAAGLWSYLVVLFEREHGNRFRAPEQYPERALATFATHDLPTFAGWLNDRDLAAKHAIGLDPGETAAERAAAREAFARAAADGRPAADFEDLVRFLGATRSRLVMIALEDMLGMLDQVNIPGTVTEAPNWKQKLPIDLESLKSNQPLQRVAAILSQAGRSSAGGAVA